MAANGSTVTITEVTQLVLSDNALQNASGVVIASALGDITTGFNVNVAYAANAASGDVYPGGDICTDVTASADTVQIVANYSEVEIGD